MLSKRAQNLKPSPTLALAARAKELAAEGKSIISLSVGEPDWPTFEAAVNAGIDAIRAGNTKYVPSNGIPELRTTIAQITSKELGVNYDPSEVTVSAGGKFILFSALQSLCDKGDEVLISAPYWVSYPVMVELAEGTPVIVDTKANDRFHLQASALEKAITPKTKIVLLNSPSNPTGEVYSREELKAIADVLKKYPKIIIISDDIYNRLVFEGETAPHILHVAPELKDRTLVLNGASKTLSMTGWRVGWALGPKKIIQAMTDYQSQSVSCAAPFAQVASRAALLQSGDDLKIALKKLKTRRDFALQSVSTIEGLSCDSPGGAFYLWVNVSKFFGKSVNGKKVTDSAEFCKLLLEEYGVAVVPGKEFGTEGYLRMSYVQSEDKMRTAFERLAKFCSQLK